MLIKETEPDADCHKIFTFEGNISFDVPQRYRVQTIIGRGAYGVVCSAIDTETQEEVAIKKITHLFADTDNTKRVLREVKVLQFVWHQNILELIDLPPPREKDRFTFTELYVVTNRRGTSLSKIFRSSTMEEDHISFIATQLLMGLQYLHERQIVHRDIKPGNILINEQCAVQLCDFGLARGLPRKPPTPRFRPQPPPSSFPPECVSYTSNSGGEREESVEHPSYPFINGATFRQRHHRAPSTTTTTTSASFASSSMVPEQDTRLSRRGRETEEKWASQSEEGRHERRGNRAHRTEIGSEGMDETEMEEEEEEMHMEEEEEDDENEEDGDVLTHYVYTRFYRPPELVLGNTYSYSYAVDMWALGCTIGELIQEKPMFPGKDYIHQVALIARTLGFKDIPYEMCCKEARDYISSIQSTLPEFRRPLRISHPDLFQRFMTPAFYGDPPGGGSEADLAGTSTTTTSTTNATCGSSPTSLAHASGVGEGGGNPLHSSTGGGNEAGNAWKDDLSMQSYGSSTGGAGGGGNNPTSTEGTGRVTEAQKLDEFTLFEKFLKALLVYDPRKRSSAAECLKEQEWVSPAAPPYEDDMIVLSKEEERRRQKMAESHSAPSTTGVTDCSYLSSFGSSSISPLPPPAFQCQIDTLCADKKTGKLCRPPISVESLRKAFLEEFDTFQRMLPLRIQRREERRRALCTDE